VRTKRVDLMGLPVDPVTGQEAVETVTGALEDGRGGWVITPNLDHLRAYRRRPELRRHFREADLVLADGMPLVWASRIQDTPLPERVAGSDLIWSLSRAAADQDASVYLVGGNPGTARAAAGVLEDAAPGLEIAGAHCPPMGFERDGAELERVEQAVTEPDPDLVYVGLPLDKQVTLIPRLRERLPGAWFLGLGISFSFVSGEVARAPRWMQAAGLEWVHRLIQEPGRLARRYLIEGLPFSLALLAHASGRRLRSEAAGSGA
jgi:N-acetylglucosaminyldiphosphoundecaprenol N-acetyl-beta-D-mannosaminyltransferase